MNKQRIPLTDNAVIEEVGYFLDMSAFNYSSSRLGVVVVLVWFVFLVWRFRFSGELDEYCVFVALWRQITLRECVTDSMGLPCGRLDRICLQEHSKKKLKEVRVGMRHQWVGGQVTLAQLYGLL